LFPYLMTGLFFSSKTPPSPCCSFLLLLLLSTNTVVFIEVLLALAYISVGICVHTMASQPLLILSGPASTPDTAIATASVPGLLNALAGVTAAGAVRYLGTCLLTGIAATHLLLAMLTSNSAEHYFEAIVEAELPAGDPEQQDWIADTIHSLLTFLACFKQLQREVSHALQDGDYTAEGLFLREITLQLVIPFFGEACGRGVLSAGSLAALVGWAVTDDSMHHMKSTFQLAIYAMVARYLVCFLYHPVRTAAKALHTQVMNSNYLVGRTLVNNSSKVSRYPTFFFPWML
jgi:hypothetical protein